MSLLSYQPRVWSIDLVFICLFLLWIFFLFFFFLRLPKGEQLEHRSGSDEITPYTNDSGVQLPDVWSNSREEGNNRKELERNREPYWWVWLFLDFRNDSKGRFRRHNFDLRLPHATCSRYPYDTIASCKSTSQLPQDCRIQLEKSCRILKHVSKPCDNRRVQVMTWATCMRQS